MLTAIQQPATIWTLATFERSRNTYKLRLEAIARNANDGISVSAHIRKGDVWRQIRIRQGTRFGDVAALCIFQARFHSMAEQHINGWLRTSVGWSLTDEQGPKRMIFGEDMLKCFHHSGSGDRTG